MTIPTDLAIILGSNLKAKIIKKVIDLSKQIAKECIIISSLDELSIDLAPQWAEGRNLVITTEISTPSQVMSISQNLYCNYKFWGSVLVVIDGEVEKNRLISCSFVGINGELLYGSEIAKQFGHGILKFNLRNFFASITSLIENLKPITYKQFETFLSQSDVGKLREIYRQSLHEQKPKIDSVTIQPILQNLIDLPRDKWDFSLHHQKVDWARGEIERLYDLCQVSTQIEAQEVNYFLAQTYAGVPDA